MDADIRAIYEHLHSRYPIILSSSLCRGFKSKIDFPVLHGRSTLGEFELFYDDVSFAFYAMHDHGEVFAHWHMQTPIDAENAVADFMQGKLWITK